MKNELALSFPASVVTRTALLIDERATDSQVGEIGKVITQIEGARSWWLGDYGLFLQNRKRKENIKQFPGADPTEIEDKGRHYMDGKAGALGIDEGNWRYCVMVCRFFKPLVRTNLSFSHHAEALRGAGGAAGDPKRAIMWLLRAEENDWPVSKLREQINKSLATSKPPLLPPLENPWAPLDAADEWARTIGSLDFPPDEARRQLTRIAALLVVIERLKELAK